MGIREWVIKSAFPKAQDDVFKCLVMTTTQIYSVNNVTEEETRRNITYKKMEIENFHVFL